MGKSIWHSTRLLLGITLIFIGFTSAFAEFRKSTSPFDQITPADDVAGQDEGFAPYYIPIDAGGSQAQHPVSNESLSAPTLETNAAIPETVTDDSALIGSAPIKSEDIANKPPPQNLPRVYVPRKIVIEKIGLEAPIIPVSPVDIDYQGKTYQQWKAPDSFAVGWHNTSALLGETGNTVLNGHHNIYGEVFRNLVELENGDIITIYSGDKAFKYVVANKLILEERFQPLENRLNNARWIMPSSDERLTLITCWPYESNTHRVVVVAVPYEQIDLGTSPDETTK